MKGKSVKTTEAHNVEQVPGGLVPDRTAVPDLTDATARAPHGHTNTVEGLDENTEAKAPGRPTHGATNNP